jgi:hypothetical protein
MKVLSKIIDRAILGGRLLGFTVEGQKGVVLSLLTVCHCYLHIIPLSSVEQRWIKK